MPLLAALLDRRVTILSGVSNGGPPIERVSQLAAFPYVVLLAEPGMGKTTVLAQQAAIVGGVFVDVRDFIEGPPVAAARPLFLDSLDEYRSDGTASAAQKLARKLAEDGVPAWWLSCRSVDWREGDLAVLQRVARNQAIVVAALAPLDPDEANQILDALMAESGVRERAHALAARAFLQNPLSLTLLVKAGGASGPNTRFALFADAAAALAHEHDDRRPPGRVPAQVLATASQLCALMLLANRAGVWRQNRPADGLTGTQRYVAAADLPLASATVSEALDTALFQRDGDGAFVPMHRTLAEFLAGRALAGAVAGGNGQPRLPLGRVIALMAPSGRSPTDLRGAYAWTAIHLSQSGLHAEALQLIAQDPVAVLVYGDAAALSEAERRMLWDRLAQDDPWFLAGYGDAADTAIGGLAGDDLAGAFVTELREPDGTSHRFMAVTEALRYGPPVASVRPVLRDVALDDGRAVYERARAAEAWIAGAPDILTAQLVLYRDCAAGPPTVGNTHFRLRLASTMPAPMLDDIELAQLLIDYASCPEDGMAGRLWSLTRKLVAVDRSALLERDWHEVLEPNHLAGRADEILRALDQLLSHALLSHPARSGETVYRWLSNVRRHGGGRDSGVLAEALQVWLQRDPAHPGELLLAIAERAEAHSTSVLAEYWMRCGEFPRAEAARALLDPTSTLCVRLGVAACRAMAVDLAMLPAADPAVRAQVLEQLQGVPRDADVDAAIAAVTQGRSKSPEEIEHEAREGAFRAKAAQHAADTVATFQRNASALADGSAQDLLRLAADIRFGGDVHGAPAIPGFDRVIELVGDEIAVAIKMGWVRTAWDLTLTPAQLGVLEAAQHHHVIEPVVLAGIECVLDIDPAAAKRLLLSAALMCLRVAPIVSHPDREGVAKRLQEWAIAHLAGASAAGTAALSEFWGEALRRGTQVPLSGSWALVEDTDAGLTLFAVEAVRDALIRYPHMESNVLTPLLYLAAGTLSRNDLLALAQAALKHKTVKDHGRELWLCVAFVLDPNPYRRRFVEAFASGTSEPDGVLVNRLTASMFTQQILISQGVIEACARAPNRARWQGVLLRAHLESLQNSNDPLARVALLGLAEDETFPAVWRRSVRHALANQAQRLRDIAFAPLSPPTILQALSAGPPSNAADLFAVVVEQLRLIQAEMQTGSLNSWESYWNESPRTPKTENRCRDILARELQARLRPFGIDIPVLPEAQRAAETRADLLVISNHGKNLPLEAKRHWHPRVWTAAGTQLQGYAADVDAEHFGIYVVFWFGTQVAATPARSDRRRPSSAAQMEAMLAADLPETIRTRTAVVVVDVSDPRAIKRGPKKSPAKRARLR